MGMWTEFQNMFLPPFTTEERSPYETWERPTAAEFFADCEDDCMAMLKKWSMLPDPKMISFNEMHIYIQSIVIANYAATVKRQNDMIQELLSLHKGSATVSKTEKEGSSPFDSANPPVGES
jgi:hypothetical protein